MPQYGTAFISTSAICRNVEAVRRRTPPKTPLCVAVKADAYGHGLDQVLPALRLAGVERLAVANLEEALGLRARGWAGPVLALGPILAAEKERERTERAAEALAGGVTATITSADEARVLAEAAGRLHRTAKVEIQVDTGMGRCGVLWQEAAGVVADIAAIQGVCIEGVYMHFATSDETDLTFARAQLDRFRTVIGQLTARALPVHAFHAANSAAVFRLPDSHFDVVRPGLCIYGYWGGPDSERPDGLRPAMRITSRVTETRHLSAGSTVGYGCTWTAKRDSLVGTVALGYADGYNRLFSNKAVLRLARTNGGMAATIPVIGRVSMDQINIDLTDAGSVGIGEEVVVVDDDPRAPNSVESLAKLAGTIPYEITTLCGQRVKRVVSA
jgi:alanine racemase